eukprot:CAMPEP_0204822846 /NCGR_PEP_ID=MMETSP1346-20131115/1032_1 /ASSEMBLY_ACC=CAM_ASM_000771 /TAXON_ID=215587 /ORGANISM="Aplanochytrium stocchinoi, Strain GSBS06" /LENGTH=373 /DNA_ID=CAMNT_0051949289 /DNA_START=162 /DNA_END=1283 /DNA_ORIENTATION=-
MVSPASKKVVVLGGGYSGTMVAKGLDKTFNVTLIEKRDVMVHKFGALRGMVYGDKFTHRLVVPQDKLLKYGKIVHGDVENVEPGKVLLKDGSELEYDYLVCATGSRNRLAEPLANVSTRDGIMAYWNNIAKEIEKAKSIMLVGGGPVSVELIGEIADKYGHEKQIYLATNKDKVLYNDPPFAAGFYKKIDKQLKKLGVNVFTSEEVQMPFEKDNPVLVGERHVTLCSEDVTVDLVIDGTGSIINTYMYPEAWKDGESARIKVLPTLQVEGVDNVFAIGDINNVRETKLGYTAMLQAGVAVKNIIALEKKKKLKKYKASKPVIFVPLGRKGGAVAMPGFSLGPFFASMLKGKTVFVEMSWNNMNQKKTLKPEIK